MCVCLFVCFCDNITVTRATHVNRVWTALCQPSTTATHCKFAAHRWCRPHQLSTGMQHCFCFKHLFLVEPGLFSSSSLSFSLIYGYVAWVFMFFLLPNDQCQNLKEAKSTECATEWSSVWNNHALASPHLYPPLDFSRKICFSLYAESVTAVLG